MVYRLLNINVVLDLWLNQANLTEWPIIMENVLNVLELGISYYPIKRIEIKLLANKSMNFCNDDLYELGVSCL